jgi:hypothetical protein
MYNHRPVLEILPKFIVTESGTVALYQQDGGYESGDAETAGKRHRCYRGDDGWHYECNLISKK